MTRHGQSSGAEHVVPNNKQGQLTIWGRANSVNVQKVLWCLRELDLAYERIDAGMAFGKNREPEYLAMNPNGRVPTLVDGDFVLLGIQFDHALPCARLRPGSPIYTRKRQNCAPASTAGWTGRFRRCSRSIARCSGRWCEPRSRQRDMAAIQKDADAAAVAMADRRRQLATRRFIEGDDFTLADIALGAYARRWFGVEGISQAEAGASRSLVRAGLGPAGISAIRRAADVVRVGSPQGSIKSLNARTAGCRQSV